MVSSWKLVWSSSGAFVLSILAIAFVLSTPTPGSWSNPSDISSRQPKTLNMTMGMNMFKEMIQNGMSFRPVPPPFPSLKNLFKTNGTHLTWVPLGSLVFNNNGKIIGG